SSSRSVLSCPNVVDGVDVARRNRPVQLATVSAVNIPSTAQIDFAPGVRLHKNLLIRMPDGVRLAADVYVPVGEAAQTSPAPWPVVVDYIPYRKDELRPQLLHTYIALARAGYPVVRIDIRGTGASEGVDTDEYTPQE